MISVIQNLVLLLNHIYMPIKSYLAHPHDGKYEQMVLDISQINNCDIIPSENKEIAIVVTDTLNDHQDKELQNEINTLKSLKMLSMVSGFETE